MDWDGVRFHHATQSGVQFKTYELLSYGIFHLIFSDRGWPLVIETEESETKGKGGPLDTYRCSERKVENAFTEYKMGSKIRLSGKNRE